MTFDLIAGIIIVVSAGFGYSRGAVKEVFGFLSFGVSTWAAFKLLPLTGPVARDFLHPDILATAGAIVGGFAAVYLAFGLVGRIISSQMQRQELLGGADRATGLLIGGIRGLIILGVVALIFERATPDEFRPPWMTNAFFYPLASACGNAVSRFAPPEFRRTGEDRAHAAEKPVQTVAQGAHKSAKGKSALVKHHGEAQKTGAFDANARQSLDALVERTR